MARQNHCGRRAAFSLVELLIVVGIMILMAAIALPQLKNTLQDNKLREGSRIVSAFFAQARARAASTGRPCGVWMDCELSPGTRFRQCTRLTLCEVPPIYGGDTIGAMISLMDDGSGGIVQRQAVQGDPDIPQRLVYDGNGSPRTWYQIDYGFNVGFLTILDQIGPTSGNVVEPFTIRFGYRGFTYNCLRYQNAFYLVVDGTPLASNLLGPGRGSTFQVTRRPRKVGSVRELPQGIAIDMGYSGMGLGDNTNWGYQPQPLTAPNIKFSYGQEFGVGLDASDVMQDNLADKVVVMFAPGGGVKELFIGTIEGPATSTLYFLVGKAERVGVAPFAADYNDMRNSSNIVDQTSLWISIGRQTGTIATSDNTAPILTAAASITTPADRTTFLTTSRAAARQYSLTRGQ
ncbi:MAG: pilus assembly FimT family protein [Planctomycetaceae bacterium]